MSITKVKTKSGVYAYESTPKWVPELGQSRPTKKYLGKINPVTGEIVPTTRKRKQKSTDPVAVDGAPSTKQGGFEAADQMQQLETENEQLRAELAQVKSNIKSISSELSEYKEVVKNIAIQIDKLK